MLEGLWYYSESILPQTRSGSNNFIFASLDLVGKGKGEARNADLVGPDRLLAISRALVYLRRHGAEAEGVPMDKQGFVLFEDLYRVNKTLRGVRANESDVMTLTDETTDVAKKRLGAKWENARLYVRTFQGHSINSSVDFRSDPKNVMLPNPRFLLHSTGAKQIRNILTEGLRKMSRNAIHFAPANFNARQSLYIQRQKTPFALLIDGDRAKQAGRDFFLTPNEIVICDGGPTGTIGKEFIVGIFDYDMRKIEEGFSRLCLRAAQEGIRPVPPYSGPGDQIPTPGLIQTDFLVKNKSQRSAVDLDKPLSHLAALYGPQSFSRQVSESEGGSSARPKLTVNPQSRACVDAPHSPRPFKHDLRDKDPVLETRIPRDQNRNSPDGKKRFDTSTRPKSACPKRKKMSNEGLESNNPADRPADFGCESSAPSMSPPLKAAPTPRSPSPALIISNDQFEELKNLVVDTTNQFMLNNLMGEEQDDSAPDPLLTGHPAQHLLMKARFFNEGFREHRLPTAPAPVEGDTAEQTKNKLKTYARGIIRATVPTNTQKRAKRRNFAARSSKKMNDLIRAGQVRFWGWVMVVFCWLNFLSILHALRGAPRGGLTHQVC